MDKSNDELNVVAMLHGYTIYEEDATEESLKAEYLNIMGEPYKTREEEMQENVKQAKEVRAKRITDSIATELEIIEEATTNGFMDCMAIRDGLGWDKPKTNGSYYSSTQVAYRWITDAGEDVVYLIPDGITRVPKFKRTGVYAEAFKHILAFKEAYYARLKHDQWTVNMSAGSSC